MQEDFDAVNTAFTEKGYGVIFGEFGVVSVNKDALQIISASSSRAAGSMAWFRLCGMREHM